MTPLARLLHAQGSRRSAAAPETTPMFLLFSNRLGCLGSLGVSLLATLLLLWLMGVL